MALNNEFIQVALTKKFGTAILGWEESYGMLCVIVAPKHNLEIVQYLYQEDTLAFRFLTDLTGVHYPDKVGAELAIVAHLHNLVENVRLRIKTFVPVAAPDTYSLVPQFPGANWMERETYDFYGINFIGHPNLKRILNDDAMDYFPMRKEFPMEDPTRRDKDDDMFGRGSY